MRNLVLALLAVAVPATATAGVTFYSDEGAFNAAIQGYVPIGGVEDFEENNAPPGSVFGFADPLCYGVANPYFPTGLDEQMCVQSNMLAGDPYEPSPHGYDGLDLLTLGAGFGECSDGVVAGYFVDSLDTILGQTAQDAYAVAWDSISFLGGNQVLMHVFDENNNLLGSATGELNPCGVFAGVVSDTPIGRINVFDVGHGAEGMDNIAVWTPEPASVLLLLGGLTLVRRR